MAHLWSQVRASRGTPAPDAAHLASFVAGLGAPQRDQLESVLALAARGRDGPGDLALISWAASCMRPPLLAQLATQGLMFTGPALFACGLVLRQDGWDMQARLAQLASNPADVDTLRDMLHGPAARTATQPPEHSPEHPAQPPAGKPAPSLGPGFDEAPLDDGTAPNWLDEPSDGGVMENASDHWDARNAPDTRDGLEDLEDRPVPTASRVSSLPSALHPLPTRLERPALPYPAAAAQALRQRGSDKDEAPQPQHRLRLFGKSAAHTLEVTDHRRGGDFMGTHVVSIDSAHALSTGGAYGWDRKLVLQLTPEEMPAIMATLMGITPSARFGHHGSDKSKFIEVRRQEGGLVIVTGDKAASYSVPVSTATAYYVLELFCRAMALARDGSGRSASDILALVKAAHGF
ncbi:MAG: hypothetical protein H7332_18135 [Bdellovibrionales bacterium]|nr:hypothetical protein [Ramlibacter sp.]